jgi:hypothetical protein
VIVMKSPLPAIVEPEWALNQLKNPDLILLDATLDPVGTALPASLEVIPGARRFDIEAFSVAKSLLPRF